MKGKFITLYGVNNIGKTTQAKLLVKKLQEEGYDTAYLKYPIYDLPPTGPELNKILRKSEKQILSEEQLQALFARNRKDYENQLQLMLQEGKIVIAEDYIGTGIAWGMAKGLSFEYMENLNKNLFHEDFALLLSGERSVTAREKNHLHENSDLLLGKVSQILLELAEKYSWKVIEIQKEKNETAETIWKEVRSFLAKR